MKKLLLLIIILSLCGCTTIKQKENLKVVFHKKTIEIHSEVYVHDLIKDTNATIVSENKMLNTTNLGTQEHILELELENIIHKKKITIEVVDKTPPIILSNTKITVEVGFEEDLSTLLMYGDNYDRNPSCIVKGDYNTNQIGSYNITYIVIDNNNNKTELAITLDVVEKDALKHKSDTIPFSDLYHQYKTTNTEIGIDISKWQESVDFNQIKEAGVTFIMMRIGVQTAPNGEITIDSYYLENIKKSERSRIKSRCVSIYNGYFYRRKCGAC